MRAFCLVTAGRIDERRRISLALDEKRIELAQRGGVEAGPHFAGVTQLSVDVHAQQQGAEAFARATRVSVAANYHLLAPRALHLDPIPGPGAVVIVRIRRFAHRPLETERARLFEEFAAMTLNFRTDTHGADAVADDIAQQPLALPPGGAAPHRSR